MKKIALYFILMLVLLSCFKVSSISLINNEKFDFIIITQTELKDSFNPLRIHKESYDISTMIVTLDDIYNEVYFSLNGRDESEQIKYFIKNAHENWDTDYIMLVGGKNDMPVRFVHYNYHSNLVFDYICDLYYADLYDEHGSFCSWDSNNDDIFGEINETEIIDEVDLSPDIYVGRILCNTSDEVDVIVNKIIDYEDNAHGSDWFKKIVLFGGDSQPSFLEFILPPLGLKFGSIAFEGEYMGNKIARILTDFQAEKIYATGLFKPNIKRLTTENINSAINQGAGFVQFSGHGFPDRIWTYLPFSVKFDYRLPQPIGYSVDDVKGLNNVGKLPVMLFSACSNGDFDSLTSPLAWEFMRHENGGAIGCIANTNPSYLIPSTLCTDTVNGHLIMSFYQEYSDGMNILGDLWAETIDEYLKDQTAWDLTKLNWRDFKVSHMTLEVWALFGDPTLKIGGY